MSLRHQREHLAFARGELCERPAAAGEELRDHLGVEGGAAGRDPVERVDELVHPADAVLEQVADAAGAVGEQLGRVLCSTYWDSTSTGRPGCAAARSSAARMPSSRNDGGSRTSTMVTSGGARRPRRGRLGVADATAATSKPVLLSSSSRPVAQQDVVLGDHDPHGSSTVQLRSARRAGW